MILTNVRDTIHANSLALFELNISILLADVTKPEKSNILTRYKNTSVGRGLTLNLTLKVKTQGHRKYGDTCPVR